MKARLCFDLDDPDDLAAHLRCTKALDMALALLKIQSLLRKWQDYTPEGFEPDLVAEKVAGVIDEHGIVMDDLVR